MKSKFYEVIYGEIGRIVNYRSIVSASLDQRYGLVAKKNCFPYICFSDSLYEQIYFKQS